MTERMKLFAMSHQMVERELDRVEVGLNLDVGREGVSGPTKDEDYYPQFKQSVRTEAAAMAEHYEVFYSLEKSIRELVREKLAADHGAMWWDKAVPQPVKR